MQDFLPRLVLLESKWLKNRNEEDFDKFGDSYIAKLSKAEFARQLEFMDKENSETLKKSVNRSIRDEYYGLLSIPRLMDGQNVKLAAEVDKEFGESILSWLGAKNKGGGKRNGLNSLGSVGNSWLLEKVSEYKVF